MAAGQRSLQAPYSYSSHIPPSKPRGISTSNLDSSVLPMSKVPLACSALGFCGSLRGSPFQQSLWSIHEMLPVLLDAAASSNHPPCSQQDISGPVLLPYAHGQLLAFSGIQHGESEQGQMVLGFQSVGWSGLIPLRTSQVSPLCWERITFYCQQLLLLYAPPP